MNSPSPLYEELGPWANIPSFRPWQDVAIQETLEAYESGKSVVFLEAPPGAGKTVIAEAVRRGLGVGGVFTCSTRSLQRQVVGDFPKSRLLEGRSNYVTLNGFDTCDDCDVEKLESGELRCTYCDPVWECPYRVAKREAEGAPLAVLNTSYLLHAMKYAGAFTERGLTIVDEGDLLPDALCDFAGVEIPAELSKAIGLEPPSNVSDHKRFNELLPQWAKETANKIRHRASVVNDEKEAINLSALATQVGAIGQDQTVRWIMEGVRGRDKERAQKHGYRIVLKAVHPKPVAYELTGHVERLLVMSATLLSAEMMALDLDLERHQWAFVSVDSPFDPARRLVVAPRMPALSKKVLDEGMPQATQDYLDRILDTHGDERFLIHTPSYHLAKDAVWLVKQLQPGRKVITYTNSFERQDAIDAWLKSKDAVFVASSLARGFDLKGDLCRAQAVFKLAIPSLGSPQVQARLYESSGMQGGSVGDTYMALSTIRELIQAAGRVCRSADDYGVTYVLDGGLSRLFKHNKQFFPKWFAEAITSGPHSRKGLLEEYKELGGHLTF